MIKIRSSTGVSSSFPKADAYWISPTGKVLPVGTLHIDEVIINPVAYSFSREEIEKIYEKYGEPIGLEGKAREEIMRMLLKRGWIRIRYIPRNDLWSIQCFNLRSSQQDYLFRWAEDLTDNNFRKYADVRLDTGKEIKQTDVEGLKGLNISSSAKPKQRERITYITDSYEFLEIPAPQD
jgi:hypothetical protein